MLMKGFAIDPLRAAQARISFQEDGKPLTQVEAARRLGVHQITLNRVENGKSPGSADLLDRMVELYGVTREWLLGEPEQVDEYELARERMATAMSKIGDGFEDFASAVALLEERARHAGGDRVSVEA
jgi:transcriptional regulator with XRE-family HTH domain